MRRSNLSIVAVTTSRTRWIALNSRRALARVGQNSLESRREA